MQCGWNKAPNFLGPQLRVNAGGFFKTTLAEIWRGQSSEASPSRLLPVRGPPTPNPVALHYVTSVSERQLNGTGLLH
jgi:hypothetical protein